MKIQKFNWQILSGFLLSLIALFSYPFVFVRWPVTRDFPWAPLLLFGVAVVLLFVGLRRAFAPDRSHPKRSKIVGSILATLGVLILGLFIFAAFIMSRWLPAAHGAPRVGQKAPDFSLADTTGKNVSLSELLTRPINDKASSSNPRGVVLIFYRGYW
jgi:hypothetical protein